MQGIVNSRNSIWDDGVVYLHASDGFTKGEIPISVVFGIPKKLENNKTVKESINEATSLLRQCVNLMDEVDIIKATYENLYLKSEIEENDKKYGKATKELKEIEDRMNEKISPYFWTIVKKPSVPMGCNYELHPDYGVMFTERANAR